MVVMIVPVAVVIAIAVIVAVARTPVITSASEAVADARAVGGSRVWGGVANLIGIRVSGATVPGRGVRRTVVVDAGAQAACGSGEEDVGAITVPPMFRFLFLDDALTFCELR